MRLEFENTSYIEDPDESAVSEGLATLNPDNPGLTLRRGEYEFMQVKLLPRGGYRLQYRECKADTCHEYAGGPLATEQVFAVLRQYFHGYNQFKYELIWEPREDQTKIGVQIVVGIAVLVVAIIFLLLI